jgi:glycosyltransferase involved in cell wall biosynthesis
MTSWLVRLKHRRNVRLATTLLRRASAATTVSEPLARDLRLRHPKLDVHVLENGVELGQVARAHAREGGFRDRGRFVVTYTGNFFGRQSAAEFLAGIEWALEHEPTARGDLLVKFVGGLKPDELARALKLGDVVEHEPFLRHDDVLATQRAADLLLLYVAPGRGSEGVYTGKVFEYVAARRPVLALAPADNVAAKLVERAGSTTSAGGGSLVTDFSGETIGTALIASWRTWIAAGGRDGAATARRLHALLADVTSTAQRTD